MTEATKHKMTMAKATEEEWRAMLDFFQHLEANVFVDSEYELGEYVREQMDGTVGAGYNRVLWGYKTMVDSVCDPELSHLELKPDLRNLEAQRDEARRWSAAWKRAAKNQRAWRHTVAEIAAKQIMEHTHCQQERDIARVQLDKANHACKQMVVARNRALNERDEARTVARRLLRRARRAEYWNRKNVAAYERLDKARELTRKELDGATDAIDSLLQERDEARAQRDEALAELDAVREALGGYDDSDLAGLADVMMSQRRLLAEYIANTYDTPYSHDKKVLKLAMSILEENANE